MAVTSMHLVYYLFLLIFCIDEGDGRWKTTDKQILQRDIKLYKKIAARVEHELQEYYAEYADDGQSDIQRFHIGSDYFESYKPVPRNSAVLGSTHGLVKKSEPLLSKSTKSLNDIPIYDKLITNETTLPKETVKNNIDEKVLEKKSTWPKFEDILLALGKKYDWKNDRWIKVREKTKNNDNNKLETSVMFHEKHRFSYRTIKLNRGKNKRNVVIAVTAIR